MRTNNKFSISLVSIIGLLLNTTVTAQVWQAEGPQPFVDVVLLPGTGLGGPQSEAVNDEQVGAVNAIAAHPTDPDIIYLGTVNGGVWKTTNGSALAPTWLPTTDDQQSLSTYDLNFDPTDTTKPRKTTGCSNTSS